MMLTLQKLRSRHVKLGFWRDTTGIGAVEFALILPLMLLLFFGVVEASTGVAVKRKLSVVTQSVSDLISRFETVTDVDVNNVFMIGDTIMTPYSTLELKARVSEVYVDPADGAGRVQWSRGDAPHAQGFAVQVPSALIARDSKGKVAANQYLIFSEVEYDYKPTVGYVFGTIKMQDRTFTRPRLSVCVLLNPQSKSDPCPTTVRPS
ncbi:Flp pilus assembly protein TadG [Rhodopseudomonas faecalis]|uniref:Flp pilus assembly protein TadG n=2 Tax=Rhodopseudomonas faecalis TaxID=99655 RepID=A0A318T9B9_9BRAD|nr:Flp pilus assembly protein TadG [Rhodopseudomonas faecalis]TAH66975.1 MAG: pilus assembly protein [Rhodopseudomonas palustris]